MRNPSHERTTKLITLGIMGAMAFVVMYFIRIPMIVPFLKYEPKDIIICIAGFIYGPMSAFAVSVVVSLAEMFLASDTGVIGLFMNILAGCSFSCTAAYIYKRKKTMKSAIIGLAAGIVTMTAVMLLWNYLITPLYMNVERAYVLKMLVPMFLPFNLIKGGINGVIIIILYKPLVTALRKAKLAPVSLNETDNGRVQSKKLNAGIIIIAVLALASLIGLAVALTGK